MDGTSNFPHLTSTMNFHLILHFLFSIQRSHQYYEGDNSVSKCVHKDIKSLQDLIKTKDEILAVHDIEEYPNSSYHVHHQYMKDQSHISTVSICHNLFCRTFLNSLPLNYI